MELELPNFLFFWCVPSTQGQRTKVKAKNQMQEGSKDLSVSSDRPRAGCSVQRLRHRETMLIHSRPAGGTG